MASYNHVYRQPHHIVRRPRTATMRLPLVLTQTLVGGVTFTSPLVKKFNNRVLLSIITFAGLKQGQLNRTLVGVVSFVGAFLKILSLFKTGILISAGNCVKNILHKKIGVLVLLGVLVKVNSRLVAGILTVAGLVSGAAARTISGVLTTSGIIKKSVEKKVAAILTTTHTLLRRSLNRTLVGILSFVGSVQRFLNKKIFGVVTFLSAVAALSGLKINFGGTLTPIGLLRKLDTKIPLFSSLTPVGILFRQFPRHLTSALSFVGGLAKFAGKKVVGVLTFAGNVSTISGRYAFRAGILTPIGFLRKSSTQLLTSILSFLGTLNISFTKALQATLSFASTVQSLVGRFVTFVASINPFGSIFKNNYKNIYATLSMLSGLNLGNNVTFFGSTHFNSLIFKTTTKKILGRFIFFNANLLLEWQKVLRSTLSFLGAFKATIAGVPTIVKIDAYLTEAIVNTLSSFESLITTMSTKEGFASSTNVYEAQTMGAELKEEVVHPHNIYEDTRD